MTTAVMEDSLAPTDYYDDDNITDSGPLVYQCLNNDVMGLGPVISFFYFLIFALSVIGNGTVLYVLLKHRDKKNITTIFVCNLAASDLLFAISLPFWAVDHSYTWIFGNIMCKLVSGTFFIGFYSSIMFLTSMAVDRYLAVVHATTAMRHTTRHTCCAVSTSIVIWTVSLLLTIHEFLLSETQTNEDGSIACIHVQSDSEHRYIWNLLLHFQQTVVFFLVPFGIILFCYCSIVKTLIRCKTQRKHRALKMIFSIILAFFICWTPFNITIILEVLHEYKILAYTCPSQNALAYSLHISRNLAFFHCCLNPVLYAFVGTNVRKHLTYPCFKHPLATASMFRPRIFSNSSMHSTKDSSAGNVRVRISTVI